jgi:hypothetical protein
LVENRFLGVKWSTSLELTDCSRWYNARVERSHAHQWVERFHCRRIGIPGLINGFACYIGAPINDLPPTLQVTVYQHFGDPLEAKRLFIRLGRKDVESQRPCESLIDWINRGYPGTWKEWLRPRAS